MKTSTTSVKALQNPLNLSSGRFGVQRLQARSGPVNVSRQHFWCDVGQEVMLHVQHLVHLPASKQIRGRAGLLQKLLCALKLHHAVCDTMTPKVGVAVHGGRIYHTSVVVGKHVWHDTLQIEHKIHDHQQYVSSRGFKRSSSPIPFHLLWS